jgi:hypothetical protein
MDVECHHLDPVERAPRDAGEPRRAARKANGRALHHAAFHQPDGVKP